MHTTVRSRLWATFHRNYYYGHEKIVKSELVSFENFFATYGLTGDALRDLIPVAMHSPHTETGITENDRHEREIQGTSCDHCFSLDWTFAITRNYYGIKSDNKNVCVLNVCTETGEIAPT